MRGMILFRTFQKNYTISEKLFYPTEAERIKKSVRYRGAPFFYVPFIEKGCRKQTAFNHIKRRRICVRQRTFH